jgi:hypothetical protein
MFDLQRKLLHSAERHHQHLTDVAAKTRVSRVFVCKAMRLERLSSSQSPFMPILSYDESVHG